MEERCSCVTKNMLVSFFWRGSVRAGLVNVMPSRSAALRMVVRPHPDCLMNSHKLMALRCSVRPRRCAR